jgi:hypothetical protein
VLKKARRTIRQRKRLNCSLSDVLIPADSMLSHSSSESAPNDLFSTNFLCHAILICQLALRSRKSLEVAFSPQLSAISVLSCFLTQNVLIDRVWCVSELHTHDSIRIFPFLAISHPCNSMVVHDFMSGIISSDTAVAVD